METAPFISPPLEIEPLESSPTEPHGESYCEVPQLEEVGT